MRVIVFIPAWLAVFLSSAATEKACGAGKQLEDGVCIQKAARRGLLQVTTSGTTIDEDDDDDVVLAEDSPSSGTCSLAGTTASTASGRKIEVLTSVPAVGDAPFTDRGYKFKTLGDFTGKDWYFVKPPNNDKNTAASKVMWTLEVPVPVTLYIDLWGGDAHTQKGLKAWLPEWTRTSMAGSAFDSWGPGIVYKKDFPAGTIEIMGNEGSNHGTFYVFVEPSCTQEPPPPVSTTPSGTCSLAGATASTTSNRPIEVLTSVPAVGDAPFTDRGYKFKTLGDFAGKDWYYVKPPNNDKNTAANKVMWTLEVPVPVTLYIDLWGGDAHTQKGLKAWLPEWTRTSMAGSAFDSWGPGIVYKKDFPAGTIEIMGNEGSNHGTFYVFVEPSCTQEPSTPVSTTTPPPVSTTSGTCGLAGATASTTSNRPIEVLTSVPAVGDAPFTDRNYKFKTLGDFAGKDWYYVKPPNNDKNTAADHVMWILEVPVPVTLYIDLWGGDAHTQKGLKAWLPEWTLTSMAGSAFDSWGPGLVYKKDFPAGEIRIMGNDGSNHGTFYVFIEPRCSDQEPPPPISTTPSGPDCLEGTGVSTTSGRSIEVLPSVPVPGDQPFTDRGYKFKTLGDFAGKDWYYVKPPNNDKNTRADKVMWTIEVPVPVTLYIDLWGGDAHTNKGLKVWLPEWTLTSMAGSAFDSWGPGVVYKKDFPAGTIDIMGNDGSNHGTFYVFIEPHCPVQEPPPVDCSLAGTTAAAVSGREIKVRDKVPAVFDKPFTDDNGYKFKTLGDFAGRDMYNLRVPNDDKDSDPSEVMWTIEVPVAVTVYIDLWGGEEHTQAGLSAWLSEWTRTTMLGTVFGDYGPGVVFKKTFRAGTIEIYGVGGGGDNGAFLVFIEAACSNQADPSTCSLSGLTASATSGRALEVVPYVPWDGDKLYSDKDFKFNSLGDFAGQNMLYLRGPDRDKGTDPSEVMWSIDTPSQVNVYLDLWGGEDHISAGPQAWLPSWTRTEMTGSSFNKNGPGLVYMQTFPAGHIDIMGNGGEDGQGNFFVFLEKAC